MSSKQGGNDKKRFRLWLAVIVVIVVVLGVLIAVNRHSSKQDASTEQSAEQETKETAQVTEAAEESEDSQSAESTDEEEPADTAEEDDTGLEFPYKLDHNRLRIDSLFQYSGVNPDAQLENGDDIASIQLKNISDQYLESAEISVELDNGTAFSFTVQDIPAGKSVTAFDTANTSYDGKAGVAYIEAQASYNADASINEDACAVTKDDQGVHLQNISGDTLNNIQVKYHSILDDMYFGGLSYTATVDSLAVDETTTVDTSEDMLGDVEIVSIAY